MKTLARNPSYFKIKIMIRATVRQVIRERMREAGGNSVTWR